MTAGGTHQAGAQPAEHQTTTGMTRRLLVCGVIGGPLLVGASFIQAITRQGFDLTRQPLSLLLLGDLGWIQLINFEVSGLLAIAYAAGVRRYLHPGRAGTWGPLLIGGWGAGLIVAGFFGPDPSMGFPPGAPAGMPTSMTGHSMIHGIGFFLSLASLVGSGDAGAHGPQRCNDGRRPRRRTVVRDGDRNGRLDRAGCSAPPGRVSLAVAQFFVPICSRLRCRPTVRHSAAPCFTRHERHPSKIRRAWQ